MRRQIRYMMLGITVLSLVLAQSVAADGKYSAGLRPLSAREGGAIVGGTSWPESDEGRTTDCSHFVHGLYEQAGYPYPYGRSRELYFRAQNFWRVRTPQPGGLGGWRRP